MIRQKNVAVLQENCVACHDQIVDGINTHPGQPAKNARLPPLSPRSRSRPDPLKSFSFSYPFSFSPHCHEYLHPQPRQRRAFAPGSISHPRRSPPVAAFVVLMLYQNIVARKAEATKDVFRVVEVSDQTVDPAIWGKNYPRQYDSYKRTVDTERTNHGGSEAFQHLDEDPGVAPALRRLRLRGGLPRGARPRLHAARPARDRARHEVQAARRLPPVSRLDATTLTSTKASRPASPPARSTGRSRSRRASRSSAPCPTARPPSSPRTRSPASTATTPRT